MYRGTVIESQVGVICAFLISEITTYKLIMSATVTTLVILHHQMKMSPLNLRIVFSVSGMRNDFIWVSKNSPCKVAVAEVTRMYHSVAHGHSCI